MLELGGHRTGLCGLHLYLQPGGPASACREGCLFLLLTKVLHRLVDGPENGRCQGTGRSMWGEDALGHMEFRSWWDVYREWTGGTVGCTGHV